MLGLVAAEDAGGLDLGSGAPREFLVEADDALHADSVGSSADGLRALSASNLLGLAPNSLCLPIHVQTSRTVSSLEKKRSLVGYGRRTCNSSSRSDCLRETYLRRSNLKETLVSLYSRPLIGSLVSYLGRDERRKRPAGDVAHFGRKVSRERGKLVGSGIDTGGDEQDTGGSDRASGAQLALGVVVSC